MSEAEGVGKYLKILMIPTIVYVFTGLVVYGSSATVEWISPPAGGPLEWLRWLGSAIINIVGMAFSSMTFPMLPEPIRIPLTVVMLFMFLYGLVGLIAQIIKILKPFG